MRAHVSQTADFLIDQAQSFFGHAEDRLQRFRIRG
jgi:hypothetical protein